MAERKKKDDKPAEAPPLPALAAPLTPPTADPAAFAPKKRKPKGPTKEALLVQYVAAREEGKRQYEAADLALQQLIKKVKVGKTVKHPVTSEEFVMTDNFAVKNVSYRPCGVNRLELKPVKGTKRTPAATEAPAETPPANGEADAAA